MKRRTFLTRTSNLLMAGSTMLLLSGCGFRLRGYDTPLLGVESLFLAGADSDLLPVVRAMLENAGTRITSQADLVLNLGQETFQEIPRTFGDAGSQEIEVRLIAPFSVQRRADGAYLLDQQQLNVETRIIVNDANLLAQEELRGEAHERLRQAAASQLLDRLRTLSGR
ncbi:MULTISPECIES: LPS assembly lipoprotein LptE [Halomonadaceae]|uniref:LPS-assembly lipoprotein LptE n=1 Tax=Halomonadaceae TaxID=28256 RepID=UPI00159B69BA|nr:MULTISPECIES: LPS assembly lipoprotein LptE [Halomonas]QJQ93995.1 hypothetical protein HIO72_00900 [Halomonas sp. PA5]